MGLRPTVKSEGSNHGHEGHLKKSARTVDDAHDSIVPSSGVSPSTASSLTNDPPPVRREAWTVRGQLLLNFHHVVSLAINSPEMVRKCSQVGEDMMRGGGGSMAEQYGAEAAMIVENKSKRDAVVRNKAVALGLFSFVAMRSGRGLSALVRRSIAANSGRAAYQLDAIPTQAASPAASGMKRPGKFRRFFSLALDATISTSITLLSGTFLFMPRPSAYMEDMSKLPLVEGKSVYAEMVCPPLLKEYRRVVEHYGGRWPVRGATSSDGVTDDASSEQLTQEDVSLNVIRKFVENCYKRSKYEVSAQQTNFHVIVYRSSRVMNDILRI
jgi:hypothetical protein